MAQKAYGSITITDLLDTATYIYYSSSNSIKLADWHKDARSADKYIGVYSGKSLDNGQPTNPTQDIFNNMERQLFVGEDGEDGRGISSVEIRYAIGDSGTTAPSTGWQQNVPSVPQGKYLWTRTITTYTTGNPTTTYSVSFLEQMDKTVQTVYYIILKQIMKKFINSLIQTILMLFFRRVQ